MALCPTCHDMCTKGALIESEQRELKTSPYNIGRGYLNGQLHVHQDFCAIELGTCMFFGESIPFSVNGTPLLSMRVRNQRLNISTTIFDKGDILLAEVADNEWISGEPSVWDLWSSWRRLRIRTRSGDVRLDIDATTVPMKIKAKLRKSGKIIKISPKGVSSSRAGGGLDIDNMVVLNVSFNFDTTTNRISVTGGKLKREFDRQERLAWGMAEMNQGEGAIETTTDTPHTPLSQT